MEYQCCSLLVEQSSSILDLRSLRPRSVPVTDRLRGLSSLTASLLPESPSNLRLALLPAEQLRPLYHCMVLLLSSAASAVVSTVLLLLVHTWKAWLCCLMLE